MSRRATPAAAAQGVHYQVLAADLHAHLFRVTLTVAQPQAVQLLQLPVWIPGSYLVREFAKHLQNLRCQQAGAACAVEQSDKASWRVHCRSDQPLQVEYEVYAFDTSVRTAWLDASRGFFNGTSLFLRVVGAEALRHTVQLERPVQAPDWKLATALEPYKVQKSGFGTYQAPDYDTLVDCPVEMGNFWSGSFEACGVSHRFVVSGAADGFDGAQLLADTQAICEAEIRFWHGSPRSSKKAGAAATAPFANYLFLLNAVHEGYGGLEHRNSTALMCGRQDLPRLAPRPDPTAPAHRQPEGYTVLLGLISHEYFHSWNVKRLRPAELARYDYQQENYTELLWFFEGFTSYYDDLLLHRAGRIDSSTYLKLLGKNFNQVQQTPGRQVQSVAQSSFDAWTKYYRQDENTVNATISYYGKGALVALCLDLTLRAEGRTSLDAVMRGLWQRCGGGPMTEQDVRAVLHELAGRPFDREMDAWVHGTQDLPVAELLQRHGVKLTREPLPLALQLGLRFKEGRGLTVQHVLRDSAAEKAGFASGDEWLAVQAARARASGPWRLHSLDELPLYCGTARSLQATVCRDRRLLTLPLTLPAGQSQVRLGVADAAALARWLESPAAP